MIAYTGKLMLESGHAIPIEASQVNPSFRSDEVEVTWKHDAAPVSPPHARNANERRGAEAVITFRDGYAEKRRVPKRYRVPALDRHLITSRTRAEARLIHMARKAGVPTPVIQDITWDTIVMEQVQGTLLSDAVTEPHLREAGRVVGRLHTAGIMHGDLTTSNMILRERDKKCVLIDFGLAQVTSEIEQRGVDLHVLFQTLESTKPQDADALKAGFVVGYAETFAEASDVISREHAIELRGRYL
jgi:N6-L-threonylcarbamoyladenine synthase/protein kinase Bud32